MYFSLRTSTLVAMAVESVVDSDRFSAVNVESNAGFSYALEIQITASFE